MFKLAISIVITLGLMTHASPAWAKKYSKKKPKISEMMAGGANNSAQSPNTADAKRDKTESKEAASKR